MENFYSKNYPVEDITKNLALKHFDICSAPVQELGVLVISQLLTTAYSTPKENERF
jgi:hypothetical protein